MDPNVQTKTRLLRVASHNKSADQTNNSDFSVVFGSEISSVGSEWGGVTGISFDSVGFPNNFPNVFAPYSEVLFRVTNPGGDAYVTPGENLSVVAQQLPNVTRTMVIGAQPNSTALAAAITAASFNLYPELAPGQNWFNATVSAVDGAIDIVALRPTQLISPEWNTVVAIPPAQISAGYQTNWIGYPLDLTNFRVVVVADGYYDNIQLANELASLIQASVGGVVTIAEVVPGFDYRYEVTSTVPIQLVLRRFPTYIHSDARQLLQQMGFFDLPTSVSTGVFPDPLMVASVTPNLFGETVVYLHSTLMSRDCRGFDGEGKIEHHIMTIPIDVPYLGYQNLFANQYQNQTIKYATPMTLTQCDLRLRNVFGDILNIGENQQMYVVFRLWYEK